MSAAILSNGATGKAIRPSENVEQIKQDDDRNGNADQPQKYTAHGYLLSARR
jgi:hypothetical protein